MTIGLLNGLIGGGSNAINSGSCGCSSGQSSSHGSSGSLFGLGGDSKGGLLSNLLVQHP